VVAVWYSVASPVFEPQKTQIRVRTALLSCNLVSPAAWTAQSEPLKAVLSCHKDRGQVEEERAARWHSGY